MNPRFFIDIKKKNDSRRIGGFGKIINLSRQPTIRIPLKALAKAVPVLLAASFLVFGSAAAPTQNSVWASGSDETERKTLENQLAELEKQIVQQEEILGNYKKQGKTLQSEIKRLEAQIAKMNLQIKAINLSLAKLDGEIAVTQNQISGIEKEMDLNKKSLSEIIKTLHENDARSAVEILLANPQLSDFFGDLNNLLAVQDNLNAVLVKITESRQKLVDQKEILALERDDATSLKKYQEFQKSNLMKTQSDKNSLLKITKGKESEYQKLLSETKKTAAEVRKQIFKFLGGGELDFEKAYELAKFAEKATGVRAALILAVLDKESALGRNVGRCDYKTAMHPNRDIPLFLEIIKELKLEENLNAGVIKISCANADGAYGGAMGPAQFIPSTWNLYKNRIAEITGTNPASPWRNTDAFVATALYLKDAGAAGGTLSQEKIAAAKYYAGNRWRNYLSTYGARVITLAQKFQEDIAILSG